MNSDGADQTAQMRRLVCAFVVRNPSEDRFSRDEAHGKTELWKLLRNPASMFIFFFDS